VKHKLPIIDMYKPIMEISKPIISAFNFSAPSH